MTPGLHETSGLHGFRAHRIRMAQYTFEETCRPIYAYMMEIKTLYARPWFKINSSGECVELGYEWDPEGLKFYEKCQAAIDLAKERMLKAASEQLF